MRPSDIIWSVVASLVAAAIWASLSRIAHWLVRLRARLLDPGPGAERLLEEWLGVLWDLKSSRNQFGFAFLLFKDFQRLQLEVEFRNNQDHDIEALIDERVQEALRRVHSAENTAAMPPLSYDGTDPEMSELISRFLVLIRDYFRQADRAAFFLERRAGKASSISMANLRDVLSHLATMLDAATPADRRRDQFASAEEHMRRAIIEPYQVAIGGLSENFAVVYEKFKKKTHSLNDRVWQLKRVAIERKLAEIHENTEKGKSAKAVPLGSAQWEEGVAALVNAYDGMSALHSQMEDYLHENETPKRKHVVLLIAAGVMIGLVCAFLLRRFGWFW